MKINKNKLGFTLVEMALVLTVSTVVGFVTFSQLLKKTEYNKAKIAGEEIKNIGDATDAYISNHYNVLSTLTNSTNTINDVGPRICSSSNNICTITIQTLVNENLLPSTYSGTNVYGSGYSISLMRSGASPYYKIYGLVTTTNSLKIGNNIRYDLLGQAMQAAGVDSGMTKDSSTEISGYNGSWTANAVNYSSINKTGLLAYQTGYGAYDYSVFLRRDGTLPMTGDLNMGNNSINNADNITASGTTTSGTLKSTGSTSVGTNLTVGGTGDFSGNVGVRGINSSDQPPGYLGGVLSPDFYAQAGIYIAKSGTNISDHNWALQANRDGYLGVSGNISAGGSITAAAQINAGRELTSHNGAGDAIHWGGGDANGDYEIRMDSNIPLTIWQPNSNTRTNDILKVWGTETISGNLSVQQAEDANGEISASGNITSNGTVSGKYLLSNSTVSVGSTCSPNGIQSRTSSGMPAYCVDGEWQTIGSMIRVVHGYKQHTDGVTVDCNSNEVAIAGGGDSFDGVDFIDEDGGHGAPGLDTDRPADNMQGWYVSGMHPQSSNPENLNVYAVCMRKW